jgi:hypothetical protein
MHAEMRGGFEESTGWYVEGTYPLLKFEDIYVEFWDKFRAGFEKLNIVESFRDKLGVDPTNKDCKVDAERIQYVADVKCNLVLPRRHGFPVLHFEIYSLYGNTVATCWK